MACSITVGVRVRPFNTRELKYQSKCVVDMDANTTYLSVVRQGKIVAEKPREFTFDFAFWTHAKPEEEGEEEKPSRPYADQQIVYEKLGKPIVLNATQGYNACLFAYGQTGSGKTYSMMGTGSDPGVLPRIGTELFTICDELTKAGQKVEVSCSFAEIYNDIVQDLMSEGANREGLQVRKHPKLGIFVQGLKSVTATNPEEFRGLLDHALSSRAVSSTKMNNTSSRSHAVIMVSVVQTDPTSGATKTGKMSLVDLAGSERAESTGATGSTMVEAQNINYSLTVLGMCLSRLADLAEKSGKDKGGSHVPFRDSQLTYLLSDNLGGNSKTSMLAALSPADVNFEETLSTLRFASVTKKVKTVAVVNESANAKMIRELREELTQLRQHLQTLPSSSKPTSGVPDVSRAAAADGTDPAESVGEANDEEAAASPPAAKHADPNAEMNAPSGDEEPCATDEVAEDDAEAALSHLETGTFAANEVLGGSLARSADPSDTASPPSAAPAAPMGLGLGLKLNLAAMKRDGSEDRAENQDDDVASDENDGANAMALNDMRSPDPSKPPAAAPPTSDPASIDWRKPLFVRLSRTDHNEPAAIPIGEGQTRLAFDGGAECFIGYSGLTRETTLKGIQTFHNGMLVDESVCLRHNDRVIVGHHVFRFSHGEGIGNACDFDRDAKDPEHCILLEKFERATLIEARAKDGMAILKAYLGPILQQRANPGAASTGPIDTSGIATPRGSHPVVGALLDDLQFFNSASFRLETQLAEEYPASLDPNGNLCLPEDTTTELDEALAEQRRQQEEKESIVRQLRDELHRAASRPRGTSFAVNRQRSVSMANRTATSSAVASPTAVPAPKASPTSAVAPDEGDAVTTTSVPAEDNKLDPVLSAATSAVDKAEKQQQLDACSEASPASPAAAAGPQEAASPSKVLPPPEEQWESEAWVEDDEEEAARQEQLDHKCVETVLHDEMQWHKVIRTQRQFRQSPSDSVDLALWQSLSANPPFMSDPCLAIQRTATLPVCDPQVHRSDLNSRCVALSSRFLFLFRRLDGRERVLSAIYLPGCTVAVRKGKGKEVFVDITPACPRAVDDKSVSGPQAMLTLQLKTQAEAMAWSQWIERHAMPEQPMTMMKRSLLQLLNDGNDADAKATGVATIAEVGDPFDLRNSWKHDSTAKGCINCKKDFTFFRRKHHCRDCGGIFCDSCLVAKKCSQCRQTTTTQKGNLTAEVNTRQTQRNIQVVRSSSLANGHLLQEYFQVKVKAWPNVAAYRACAHAALDKALQPAAILADTYRARLDKWPGSHIVHFRRCPRQPRVLLLWINHGGSSGTTSSSHVVSSRALSLAASHPKLDFYTLAFLSAGSRERGIESLSLLVGRRAYMTPETSSGIALLDESDILVEHHNEGEAPIDGEEAPCCLVKATSSVSLDLRVWVGNDGGRVVLQQGGFNMLGLLGRVDYTPWDAQSLAAARLEVLAKVPFDRDGARECLYILVDDRWLQLVEEMSTSRGRDTAAVAVHLQESSVLFIASTCASSVEDDFIDIDEEGEDEDLKHSDRVRRQILGLSDLGATVNPDLDIVEQFDSVFIIGHSGLAEFTATPAPVQYRSPTFQLARASPNHIEGEVAIASPVLSKLSPLPSSTRRQLTVTEVTVDWVAPFVADDPQLARCNFKQGKTVDLEAANMKLSSSCPHFDVAEDSRDTIMLANLMPEYVLQRCLLVHFPGVGTARVPLALYQAPPGTVLPAECDVHNLGERVAKVTMLVTVKS